MTYDTVWLRIKEENETKMQSFSFFFFHAAFAKQKQNKYLADKCGALQKIKV